MPLFSLTRRFGGCALLLCVHPGGRVLPCRPDSLALMRVLLWLPVLQRVVDPNAVGGVDGDGAVRRQQRHGVGGAEQCKIARRQFARQHVGAVGAAVT